MDKRTTEQIQNDPKTEATNMYKHVVCEAMLSPNSIPVHLSEPFNISVEFIRISQDWDDLELLDKSQQTIEKIKINTISSVELSNNGNPLNNSGGGSGTPILTRSNSILNRGALGSNSSSDDLLTNGSPVGSPKSSSKASMLLGLDEGDSSTSSSSPKSSKKPENKNTVLSPKFGLLARSASNNLLNVNKLEKLDQPLSPTLSSSPSTNLVGVGSGVGGGSGYLTSPPLNISGSSPVLSSSNGSLNSSNGSLSISPSNTLSPRGNDLLSSSIGGSSILSQSIGGTSIGSGGGVSGTLHYNQGFTIATKNINYTFNAPDKDGINHIMNSVKMLAQGRPYQEQLQQTFDAIVESLLISQTCKIPTIPPLPTSPPPPPPLLLVQITNKQSEA
ncbi:hypothetical protein RB653_000136 [Dictyostelium firmibasis]|uniref:Uncharacterized protein n=1 Tax=Dictyostelium firmibasis TaxID=79012 RepID=A0AAN7U5K8_9MYCE